MILNNFASIISKRKQLKPIFKLFIKQFQQQLSFIEEMIQNDAREMQKQGYCKYAFRKLCCLGRNLQSRFQMYNPAFYKVFTVMSVASRQEYFIELLNFIQKLGHAYDESTSNKSLIETLNVNKFRSIISNKLVDQLVVNEVITSLKKQEQSQACVELIVDADGVKSQKVGRLKNFKFQMIEKIKGQETKMVIDLRSFAIINYNKPRKALTICAIYENIKPSEIQILFSALQNEKQFQKYLQIFLQIEKIGKIEKLITNIDLVKIFGKNFKDQLIKQIKKQNNLMNTFLKQENEEYQSQQKHFLDSEEIINGSTMKRDIKLKRIQTIKFQHYEEMKKRLIETLNFLSQKKAKQNQKVIDFRKRQAINPPKYKSDAIIRVLKSTQAFIPRKNAENNIIQALQMEKDILTYAVQIQNENHQSKLSIINRNNQYVKQQAYAQSNDSFFVDSNDNMSLSSEKFHKIFSKKQEKTKKHIQYNRNMYKKLYPQDYDFNQVQSLMQMIKFQFSNYYVLTEQSMLKQSNNLVGDKLSKFKANWLQKLTKTARVYYRKQNQNFFKILIPFTIQIRALVQAITNVQSYHYWHPNIKKVDIVTTITSENIIIYRMTILNPITMKIHTQLILMHLFRLEGKYYIIQKIMQDEFAPKQTDKGLLKYLSFNKSLEKYSKMKYLMMRVSNISKNGICQMNISIDYDPLEAKYADGARKQLLTIFLNFVFIVNYWKLSTEQKKFNPYMFNYDWIVSKESFEHDERIMSKQVLNQYFDDMNLRLSKLTVQKQANQNVQSSSELIQNSQYFDL